MNRLLPQLPPSPITRLLVRLAIGVLVALAIVGLLSLLGMRIPLPLPIAVGLAIGAIWWMTQNGATRDDPLHAPELDLDADYALPHARDMRVRRLEDLIHGAQPTRRMTARGLARTLGDIADERAHDPAAPPLDEKLSRLIADSRHADAESHPVGPIDRRALHRYLRELAAGEERER
ncbi:hypothetical protein [Brachybacterium sp. AOP3-A1-3]|uniref:hypothetical protein n=1 Tax=Brachybacterium sp. AOP3-A1-3 TaxID=3457699 RepID=UPI0040335208